MLANASSGAARSSLRGTRERGNSGRQRRPEAMVYLRPFQHERQDRAVGGMADLSTVTDIRDVVIIVFGIVGLVALTLSILFTVLIGWGLLKLIRVSRSTVKDGVAPALENAAEAARGMRGTAEFVEESVVSPIIRVYGLFSGLRRGFSVLSRTRKD